MLPEITEKKILDELKIFIEFGVSQAERVQAMQLMERYRGNLTALIVLMEFYKVLPEAREEAVIRLGYITSREGTTLLGITTTGHEYLAVVSENNAHILGEYGKEKLSTEILNFFGYQDNETLCSEVGSFEKLKPYGEKSNHINCPACGVEVGEFHIFGCPVEVCPWCDGQLSNCNCRFDKLEVESLDREEQLDEFLSILEAKGRVAFSEDQKPGYPGTSEGLDD